MTFVICFYRLKIIEILSIAFRQVLISTPNDLLACVYLTANMVCLRCFRFSSFQFVFRWLFFCPIFFFLMFFLRGMELCGDLLLAACYLIGILSLVDDFSKVAPAHEGVELGVGDGLLVRVIAESTGRTPERIKQLRDETGDLGIVAQSSRNKQGVLFAKPKPLTVSRVFQTLREIANASGKDVCILFSFAFRYRFVLPNPFLVFLLFPVVIDYEATSR